MCEQWPLCAHAGVKRSSLGMTPREREDFRRLVRSLFTEDKALTLAEQRALGALTHRGYWRRLRALFGFRAGL